MQALKKILYAEDEKDIRDIATMALEAVGGFTLKACSSGETVLQVAIEFAPDLILLDVMMPGLDGINTFKGLRKLPELKNTPIIFMTAKVQSQEVEKYKEMGVIDVIHKPFDPMSLPTQLRTIWDSYHVK
jgi:CheY-like chemotaxis protein